MLVDVTAASAGDCRAATAAPASASTRTGTVRARLNVMTTPSRSDPGGATFASARPTPQGSKAVGLGPFARRLPCRDPQRQAQGHGGGCQPDQDRDGEPVARGQRD